MPYMTNNLQEVKKYMNNYYPEILYKYRNADDGIKILSNLYLWFSSPTQFRDKYDSRPKFEFTDKSISSPKKAIQFLKNILISQDYHDKNIVKIYGKDFIESSIIELKNGKNPKKLLDSIFSGILQNDLRILSLCNTNLNGKMWKEYADNHQGIIIGIKTKNLFKDRKPFEVKYHTDKDFPIKLNGTFYDYYSITDKAKYEIFKLFYTKNQKYKYENEYRFMFFVNSEKKHLNNISKDISYNIYALNNPKGYEYPISKWNIDSIYLGEKINILDKLQIYNIVKTSLINTNLYQCYRMKNILKFKQINTD